MTATLALSTIEDRYRQGENRREVFADLVLATVASFAPEPVTALDIGCGHGFLGKTELQRKIASKVDRYLGVEPDQTVEQADFFSVVYHSILEEAPIASNSVHVAFAAFVLEHVKDPDRFLQRLHEILVPGGVFLGFTVDGRHPFSQISWLMGALHVKDWYLDSVRGKRGVERYENYETFYRINTPKQLQRNATMFQSIEWQSLHRVGQLDFYLPRLVRPVAHLADRFWMRLNLPGSMLVVRMTK